MKTTGLYLILAVLATGNAVAADWLQFRGPQGAGKTDAKGLPVTWSAQKNVLWKIPLPGFGASSPIIVGDRVLVTCYRGYGLDAEKPGEQKNLKLSLDAFDVTTGKRLWSAMVDPTLPDKDYQRFLPEHGYASATAASDGQAVYAFFGKSGLHAFSLEGKTLWSAAAGAGTHNFGSAASPLLYENLVIVNACVESDAVIAFDKKTGREVWRTEGIERAWSSPVLVEAADGRQEIVLATDGPLIGYDPDSGEKLWWADGIDDYVCPSVVSHDGVAYALGGRREVKALAVRVGGRGEVTSTHRLWKSKEGSKVPSPVYHDGHLYWVQHQGIACCMEAATGKMVYKERLEGIGSRNKTYASVLLADGKLYAVTCHSGTFVFEARPEFKQLAHNELDDDSVFNASPAVSGGRMFLRSDRYLYCLGSADGAP
jgi:outer membrane protein assembly factor BamB